MSVLIKGMEMPKLGMVVNIHADGRVTRHFDEFGKMIGKAVSVPPHGRLIDADDIENITVIMNENGSGFNRIIAPTIIEAEEGE